MADAGPSSHEELSRPIASISTVLQDLITDHYAFRGTIWKCPSPMDFAPSPAHPAILARAAAIYSDGPAASGDDAHRLLMDTFTGLVHDHPAFMSVSTDLRYLLISDFSSAIAVALEAGTHAPYTHSPANSASGFNALLLAVRQEPGGETILNRWAAANILPAMTSAMGRLVGRSEGGVIEVSSADRASTSRKQQGPKPHTRPHKRARHASSNTPYPSPSSGSKQNDNAGPRRTVSRNAWSSAPSRNARRG
ncbi:hypothetical protein EV122DRAFT_252222 [Schizophyllum commune]